MRPKSTKNCEGCEECEQPVTTNSIKDGMWSSLLQHKKILINGEIDDSLIERAVMQIVLFNEYDDEQESLIKNYVREPIHVIIHSDGGSLDAAFALISVIEESKTMVHTSVLGKAYSAGFLILIAGDYRTAGRYSRAMLHQGSSGISGDFSRNIKYAKHWEKIQNQVDKYVVEKTKIKGKKLTEIFETSTDWYFDAEEMMKFGVVDDIQGITDVPVEEVEDDVE